MSELKVGEEGYLSELSDTGDGESASALLLSKPIPITQHPAAVYLRQLAPSSRKVMEGHLTAIARLLSGKSCDYLALDWSLLRYCHAAAIRDYLQENYAPATANLKLTCLKQVVKMARRLRQMSPEDCEDILSLPPIRGQSPEKGRCLSAIEMLALIGVCLKDAKMSGVRDAAAIALLRAGLRRSEVVDLDLADFDPQLGKLQVKGKGQKYRSAYLPPDAIELVNRWIAVRGNSPGPLLNRLHKSGHILPGRLSDDALVFLLDSRRKQASLDEFSPHDFRRTFVSNLLEAGVDLVTVQKLAGHANLATTARYDRRDESVKRNAVSFLTLNPQARPETDANQ